MIQVFISYQRKSSSILAQLISRELEQNGIKTFVDVRSLESISGPFPEHLYKAIENSDVFICLLGKTTLESELVCEEIKVAYTLGKQLIPIYQESFLYPSEKQAIHIEHLLISNGIKIYDISNTYIDQAMLRLVSMIKSTVTNSSEYFEIYKNNVISEINNNLVIELYEKDYFEDICITPLVFSLENLDKQQPFDVSNLIENSRSVIIGMPGSGKTTALRIICLELLRETPVKYIPIYVPLAAFGDDYSQHRITSFSSYLTYEVSIYGCADIDALLNVASDAEIILALDGWDEVLDERARDEIRRFISQTKYKYIMTSRPEGQRSLPFAERAERYEMYPLNFERMREFVRLRIRNEKTVEQLLMWLSNDSSMMALAENPLNLSIITIVFVEENGNVGKLTKTKLYQRAFEAIVRQMHRYHSSEGTFVSYEIQAYHIELILQSIAYKTSVNGSGRFFTPRELEIAAMEILGNVPRGLQQLFVGKLGIIRDRRSGRMEFFHLWYQEFLAGRYIVETSTNKTSEFTNKNLATSLPFVVGLIPSKPEAFHLMLEVSIYDVFNYCRAIQEGDFSEEQLDLLLGRIITYAESQSPIIPVRVELAKALSQTGLATIRSLSRIAKDQNRSDYQRRAALEALALMPVDKTDFDNLLLELLQVESLGLLWHVVEHVGNHKVLQAKGILHKYVNHSDPILAGGAVWALGQIENVKIELPDRVIQDLIADLSSDDLHAQGHALRTIGRNRLTKALPKLKEHLSHKDTGYRWIVAEAAALIGGKEGLEVLELALRDDDPRVVASALIGISQIDMELPNHIKSEINAHIDSSVWIPFLDQNLGSVARSVFQKIKRKEAYGRLPRIFIIRHCSTLWTLEQRIQGSKDLPLIDKGRNQALSQIKLLSNLGLNRIITSPYLRAFETAKIYADNLKIPLHVSVGFRELDHGDWEGQKFDELLNDSSSHYREWVDDPTNISIPNSSESITTAQQRVLEAIREIVLMYNNETILVVTHKHIRAILQCTLENSSLQYFKRYIYDDFEPMEIPTVQIAHLAAISGVEGQLLS